MTISNFIYGWLKDIVFVFILLSLFKMIMPKGNMKRYMEHIIGLLIIITVVTPLLKLNTNNLELNSFIFKEGKDSIETSNTIWANSNLEVEKLYIDRIKDEVSRIVKENSEKQLLDVKIHINKEGANYGAIDGLEIVLSKTNENMDGNKKIRINKIQTDYSSSSQNDKLSNDTLSTIISKELGITEGLISIYKN